MHKLKKIVLCLFLVFTGFELLAVPFPAGGGEPDCWPPPCIPIDNEIIVLLIGGFLFGLFKLYQFSRVKNAQK